MQADQATETTEYEDDQVMQVVDEIRSDPHRRTEMQLRRWRTAYGWFFDRYPKLADMCVNADAFDPNLVRFMLQQKREVDRSLLTQHNASVAVGERLAKTYVYPKLDK